MISPLRRTARLSGLAAALLIALALGACSRSPVASGAGDGSGKPGPHLRDIPINCPSMIPNTPETAIEFVPVTAMCASFRSTRIRFEMIGDLPSPSIDLMGPCVASANPLIRFLSGHADVFLAGTNTSITPDGQPVTFGELLSPGALVESGIVLAISPFGDVLEVIWPALAGVGVGQPIIRVQLARWNTSLVSTSQSYDIVWDMMAQRDSTQMYFKGKAVNVDLSGAATPQIGASSPPPCPQTLEATSDTVVTQLASIVQFRPNRLRIQFVGDVPSGVINATGLCAASDTPTIHYVGGAGDVYRAGTTQSMTTFGQELVFGALPSPGLMVEPGIVLATDAQGNVLEIIWPGLAGLAPGPPILRLELVSWNPAVHQGVMLDAMMRFDAVGPDGSMATYTARGRRFEVPAMK